MRSGTLSKLCHQFVRQRANSVIPTLLALRGNFCVLMPRVKGHCIKSDWDGMWELRRGITGIKKGLYAGNPSQKGGKKVMRESITL